ncbi:hypothetical protein RAM80_07740 [Pseudomonas sp. App30]|uniref:hypothetical protein n=1 Tax=Pseudomonas sp. App30 TaxID=3068990 RepID=UPI003A7FE024
MSSKFIIFEDRKDYLMYVTHIAGSVGQFNGEHEAFRFASRAEAEDVCSWLNDPETFHCDHGEFKVREVAV